MTVEYPQRAVAATNKRRVAVTFALYDTVLEIPDLSCYSVSEHMALWYDADDYDIMRSSTKRAITSMTKELANAETNNAKKIRHSSTYLGLRTRQKLDERKETIEKAKLELFKEQALQWREGIWDPELLADLYYAHTCCCQQEAIDRASQLAIEELVNETMHHKILMETKSEKTKSSSSSSSSKSLSKKAKRTTSTKQQQQQQHRHRLHPRDEKKRRSNSNPFFFHNR